MKVFERELRRIASRPLYPLLMLILPVVGFGILYGIFYLETPTNLPVAVYDADRSMLSRQITRMIDATSALEVKYRVTTTGAGEDLMLQGKTYALIVLPEGLERHVKRRVASEVILLYNAQWILPGSLIGRDVRRVVATVSGGIDLQMRRASGATAAGALAHIEPIRPEMRALFNPQLNYVFFLILALLPTLLQIFIVILSVHVLGIELNEGTSARWLDEAGGSAWKAIIGKLLPYTATYFLVGCIMLTAFFGLFGMPLRGSATIIVAAILLFVLAYQAVALLIVAWSANLRLATSVASFYSGPAFAFTGVTFPLMAMPGIAKLWAALLPLTHLLKVLNQQTLVGAPWSVSALPLIALSIFIVVAPLISVPRLIRVATDPHYWRRQ